MLRQKFLSWSDVDALVEHLMPQFVGSFDAILMVARGGVVPGGLIAERWGMNTLYTTTVTFPADQPHTPTIPGESLDPTSTAALQQEFNLRSMPEFQHFPPDILLRGKRILVVNHIWNHGRSINAVAGRVAAAGGRPELCVFHYKPNVSIFTNLRPDYYAAITDEFIVYPWESAHRLEPYRPMPEIR